MEDQPNHVIVETGYNDFVWCEEHQRVEQFAGTINPATGERTARIEHGI